MGYAWQKGLLPLKRESIEKAIELNDVAVAANMTAFNWGRVAAHDEEAVTRVVQPLLAHDDLDRGSDTLAQLVDTRAAYLTAYQDERYAARYRALVAKVAETEQRVTPGTDTLARAVARYYFKLLGYKDEYEVARLYTDGTFAERLKRQFSGDFTLTFHLAPPLIASRDPQTGHLKKGEYGSWVIKLFSVLAAGKRLRGTALDIFGWTEERRTERRLISEYEAVTERLLASINERNHHTAVHLAEVPEVIRGFGHVKVKSIEAAKSREAELLVMFESPEPETAAAAQAAD